VVFWFYVSSFWEDPKCRPKELGSGMVLAGVGMTEVTEVRQMLSTESIAVVPHETEPRHWRQNPSSEYAGYMHYTVASTIKTDQSPQAVV